MISSQRLLEQFKTMHSGFPLQQNPEMPGHICIHCFHTVCCSVVDSGKRFPVTVNFGAVPGTGRSEFSAHAMNSDNS